MQHVYGNECADHVAACTAGTAVSGMQVEEDIGLDETQAQELDSKRHRESNAATDLLQRCAQDAANKATCEMTTFASKLMQESEVLEQRIADRIAERDTEIKALSESVDTKIMNLSATVDGKLQKLEQRVQEQWVTFENKWAEKTVHTDDREAAITQAEFRIRRAVQREEDER